MRSPETFDLFVELGATDEQADFPVLYGSGLDGWLVRDLATDLPQDLASLVGDHRRESRRLGGSVGAVPHADFHPGLV